MEESISFIVSTFNRTRMLRLLIQALNLQTVKPHEIFVCDNSLDRVSNMDVYNICKNNHARHLKTGKMGAANCYNSAPFAVAKATGTWLCFPCDDDYYVPRFSELMLKGARENNWDFVYCDMIIDIHLNPHGGEYQPFDVSPVVGRIGKCNMILKREHFRGFPDKDGQGITCDGQLAEEIVARGIPHGKVPGILHVHN